MRIVRVLVIAVAIVSTSSACRSRRDAPSSRASSSQPPTTNVEHTVVPPLPSLSATSGGLALDNLDAQIDSFEKRQADRSVRAGLVELLLSRGQFLGKIADYERAASIAEQMVVEMPDDALGYQTRAGTHSTFHRFDLALADLDHAEKLGIPSSKLTSARAAILSATGRYDEAWALRPKDESLMTVSELANAGFLAGDMGSYAEADRLLDKARDKYVDVSPFPLSFFDATQAALCERRGDEARAQRYYQRALSLLPQYAKAAAHLAAISRADDAIAMLEPLTKTSDDPEVDVRLADALRLAGRTDEAKEHLDKAIARYDDLLKKYPEAFADHAAAMWLGEARDPKRALPLAELNVHVRQTSEAYELLLSSALAAGDASASCGAARAGLALKYATESLRSLAAPIVVRCAATP